MNKTGIWVVALYGLFAIGNLTYAAPDVLEVCTGCHGENGSGAAGDNVPIISGTPAAHLEEALYAYQDGARQCVEEPIMCEEAAGLSATDIVELAEHFSAMSRIQAGEQPDAALVEIGERLHTEHCAKCHVLPDDENAEYALGIPLQGQRSAYLKLTFDAYQSGDRETLVPEMARKLELLSADDIDALINYYSSYQL